MLQNRGEQLAIAFGKDQITYGNLFAKLELYAGLCEMGKGERAVVFSENRPGLLCHLETSGHSGSH